MVVFLLLLLFVPSILGQTTSSLNVCSSFATDACQQIGRSGNVSCTNNFHDVDCLLNIENNKAQFGRVKSEVAFLGASFLSENVIVLGEIQERHSAFETVVIVKNDIPTGLENLRGKKLCHPGFKHDDAIPNLFLQELENQTIALNRTFCDNTNKTILERQISSLKYFFGDSCRPGAWSQNSDFDKYLKSEYSSLCSLCGPNKCDTNYQRPFNDSLKCLLNNNADVAITTLREAKLFFSTQRNQHNYKYFCKNGSHSSHINPCIWSQQTPDLLIGQKNSGDSVKTYLRSFFERKINDSQTASPTSATDETLVESFTKIFDLQYGEKIVFLPVVQTLTNYIKDRRTIPSLETSKLCDSTINWCTYNNQSFQKCKWLSQAALNRGIQPVVNCLQTDGNDELSCLDDIKKQAADVTVASSDYAYASLKKNLINIAYVETDSQQLPIILAVKKTNDASINNFQDLKSQSACLPRFGGKEHLAFVDVARTLNVYDGKNCDYGTLLSNFVSDSCTPGARSNLLLESTGDVEKDKLCKLCKPITLTNTHAYCNDDNKNAYYESRGSLQCLTDSIAKFAVITKHTNISADDSQFTVICRNNTLAAYPGFEVDSNCALAIITTSQVVAYVDNKKIPDIKLALYEFEKWFGQSLEKSFHLFDRFNNTKDLLFKDSTPGLNFGADLPYIQTYDTLLKRANECKSDGTIFQVSFVALLSALVVFFGF